VVSRSIARPLRRLTRAAVVMADVSRAELVRVSDSDSPDPAPPRLASVQVDSADEIGELAAALNRVQATAALLIERQVSTRGNVSVMFANIARRTQNLVGRQLALIDELERNERDPELLQRLYRLDHVATRLRRSADSLLVVSGTIEQELSGAPTRLADVVRSALAEIEGYQAVLLGTIPDVAVGAELVPDLRLLLAELFENATNFTPPGTPVEVTGLVEGDCYLAIVDHGVGMSTTRIEEENRRLVERERLDVTPTKVLGLFVVGRLARRHGLGVRLDPSEIRGVTVTVRIPARLLARAAEPLGGPQPSSSGPASPAWTQPAWIEPTRTEPGWSEGGWSGLPTGWTAPEPVVLGAVPPAAIEALRAAERTGPFPWLEAGPMAIEPAPPAVGGSEPASPAVGGSEPAPPAVGGSEPADVNEQWPGGIEEPVSPRHVPEPAATTLPMQPAAAAFSAAAFSAAASSAAASSAAASSAAASSAPSLAAPDAGAPDAGGKPALAWPPPAPPSSPGAPLPRRSVAPIDPAFSADPRAPRAVRDEARAGGDGGPAEVRGESSRGGLTRRVPGTHLADTVVVEPGSPGVARAQRNPDAERDALNDYLSGFARGSADPGIPSVEPDPVPEPESRPTLAERHS
jgi:signal transduction histidine kinase